MKRAFFIRLLFIATVLLCLMSVLAIVGQNTAFARTQGITTIETRNASGAPGSVTALVLDMSGSMAQNDPDGLRCSAANAFIDLSGPGNYIGVIGLDNKNGERGGSHNFQLAPVWAQPVEMATLAERQQLQHIIATQSNNCQPDNSTPTYDALRQALQMLTTTTNNGQIPGSVVLLTDGVPDPDTIAQMNAIQTDLLPQFKQNGWPIDSVALGVDGPVPGTNTTFHRFLSGLSDATSGKFYDDGHGQVPGVSPLNIADFFVSIFARHNHRIVNNDIPPTILNGGTTRRNFAVTDYTNSLDVVVVKDQTVTKATLITPGGQSISQSGSGVFVSSFDPHYEIFSIDRPQSGLWELDVTGSGQFLMDSLKISGIGLSSISVSQTNLVASTKAALALGQPLTVSANLTYNGQPITDNRFTLNGTITYDGALGHFSQQFALNDKNTPGIFVGNVTVPINAPPGSYEVVVNASTVSIDAVIASQNDTIRVELFPVPALNSSQGTAVQWDPVLRALYSLPFWPVPSLGQRALNGVPAQTEADITGEVQLQQQPYAQATVSAVASDAVSHATIPVTVINDGNGRFHMLFLPSSNGTYMLTFKTSGTFQDSHGDFSTSQQTVHIMIVPATLRQELQAWGWTALYLLCLLFLVYLARWSVMAHPHGEWLRYHEGEMIERGDFRRSRRGFGQAFFHRDLLRSREARWARGLLLRFRYGGGIEVRADGRENAGWELSDGSNIPRQFREVTEVRYRPRRVYEDRDGIAGANGSGATGTRNSDIDESSLYMFSGRKGKGKKIERGEESDPYGYSYENPRSSSSRNRRSRDDYEAPRRSVRKQARRASSDDDYDL